MIQQGDSLEIMAAMEPNFVDAIVTDPPYNLAFMGNAWDSHANAKAFQEWCEAWGREALRILKPGGHLLSFGGTRTSHRLVCGLEDAGFEIRDTVVWIYGSGFPKSLDVSKAIDNAAGAERIVIGQRKKLQSYGEGVNAIFGSGPDKGGVQLLTAPVTPEAVRWQGWGTALKPALEPCVVARKPLIGTVAANVIAYGTGALNVDGCRLEPEVGAGGGRDGEPSAERRYGSRGSTSFTGEPGPRGGDARGRWPANLILDEDAAAMVGEHARFFYCAKASQKERHAAGYNTHPTVKPVALMRWLCRLVTPPGGLILDPFCGSGSTGVAALEEGFRFFGIEKDAEYVRIALRRIDRSA